MHILKARLSAAREKFWVLPAAGITCGILLGMLLPPLDQRVTLPDWIAISGQEDTARAVLTAVATIGVSVAGVSFSVIVVALVLASQQLSPRVLRSFQRQALNQAVLMLLLGTATYALFVLGSVSDDPDRPVPELSATLAMAFAAASLALFVVFVHHAVRSLNASSVIRRIAADGHESVRDPFPERVGAEPEHPLPAQDARADRPEDERCVEVRAPRAGYIASVDGERLVAWARRHGALIEQRRPIGAFTVTGSVLARLWCADGDALDVDEVGAAFLISEERVVDGDVAFPIRQLADVALKGLSPGINDPTTAENAMDSVTDTLVRFALRPQPSLVRLDDEGVPRLIAVAPSLDDLVRLGFDQVRRDAASRPSFAIRLLELLADLRDVAPRAAACGEIDRQAELIAEQSAALAEHQADQRMVADAYARLHRDAPAAEAARR